MSGRRRSRFVVIPAIGLALTLAFLAWRPVAAPLSGEPSAEPDPSAGAIGSGAIPEVADPEDWAGVAWDEPILGGFGPPDVLRRVDGMVAGDDLLVAWGRTPMPGRNQFNDMGAIYLSRDAATWVTVPVEHGVNGLSASTVVGVAIGAHGLLAIGDVCCDPGSPAVWRSADGQAWERLEVEGAFEEGGSPASILAIPDGWLMLVVEPGGSAVVQSEDGLSWERVLGVEGTRASRGIEDIARGPDGFIAIGQAEGPDGSFDGAVWSSDDGRTWERVALEDRAMTGEGEVYLHDVIGHAGGFLATGLLGTQEQRDTCDQMALHASNAEVPLPPKEEATSCVAGDHQQWTSIDGERWQPVEPPGDGLVPIEFRVARPGGPGLLVLGEASGPGSPDTMLFGSADGVRWQVLSDAAAMLTDVAVAMVVRDDEIVAVTEDWGSDVLSYVVWRGRGS